jgi:2-hydroxyglutarate dehydrogenase
LRGTEKMSLAATAAKAIQSFDVIVVGGGIVGCATARQLKINKPNLNVGLIDKESTVAAHQSGHNSGVLHAGIYYKPGTLKAKLCVEGIDLAYDYLEKKKIPHKKVGKLIVAVEEKEVPNLLTLYERAQENKCREIQLIDTKRIREIEPNCRGLQAIWSPYTGIVDWGLVTKSYAKDFTNDGGKIFLNHKLEKIELSSSTANPVRITTSGSNSTIECKYLITCAGLHSDRVAQLSGCSRDPKIIPFRGEYLKLKPHMKNLVSTNIYPVPDPRFPFLGVHFTPNMNGDILLGPNAVLAFSREGYNYFKFSPRDVFDAVTYPGMLKLMVKYATFGTGEIWRSIYHQAQVKLLQRFVPSLKASDVTRGVAGVRAQAMDADGNLVDDFVFDGGEGDLGSRVLHVRNAPSPGATSSLAIAKMVVEKAGEKFGI